MTQDPRIASSLYPEWDPGPGELPSWVKTFGLKRYKPICARVRGSAKQIAQAEADGLPQLGPIIATFAKPPHEIRKEIGKGQWRRIHNSTLTQNVNRLALRLIGGWSWDEAMTWPDYIKRALPYLQPQRLTRGVLLPACRLSRDRPDFLDIVLRARDVQRMGGLPSPDWSRRRLKHEHDVLARLQTIKTSDPTPWAEPWDFSVDGYHFELLISETALAIEGIQQSHCVRSYANACRAGREVVCRITGHERATCSWSYERFERPQVQGAFNRRVSDDCRAAALLAMKAHLCAMNARNFSAAAKARRKGQTR